MKRIKPSQLVCLAVIWICAFMSYAIARHYLLREAQEMRDSAIRAEAIAQEAELVAELYGIEAIRLVEAGDYANARDARASQTKANGYHVEALAIAADNKRLAGRLTFIAYCYYAVAMVELALLLLALASMIEESRQPPRVEPEPSPDEPADPDAVGIETGSDR